jgi:hypothetical protein
MATDVRPSTSAPTAKHDAFVQAQLARAEKRIRTLDLTAALLGFAAGTLAYGIGMALLDHWLNLPAGARQAAFVVYLIAAVVYLAWSVALPLSRRINPYFAARQIERTLPGAKNSVVNWIDLHGRDLPAAIHGAVGRRAATDLARADLEKAVSGRRAWTAGGVASVCALAFAVALFTLGPAYFLGFLGRAFVPFGGASAPTAPTATQITLVKPSAGDAVVPDDRPVDIIVRVGGRVPDARAADALKLQFHYDLNAPYEQRLLDADDAGRWGITLPPVDVKDGFWYKVTGGDAETPEYRVRLTPRLTDFKAVYHFRPYTARAAETHRERKIEALRGTQVDLTVHANRDVKDGWIEYQGPAGVTSTQGEALPGDPQGFVIHLPPLDQSCQYRIGFTSIEGENFTEPQSFPLIAVPDKAPEVTLTKPAELKDKPGWVPPLHANDILSLEGSATDDVGIRAMRLNVRVENGPAVKPQEYRTPKDFQLEHGGNPTKVEYKDFVDLTKLKEKVEDPAFTVRPGMVLEYWLTAEDACDFPKPNVGESKHYKVQIVEPLNNDKVQQQEREKAEQEKHDSQQKQDKQQKQEDQKRNEENKKQEQKNQQGDQKGDGSGGAGDTKKPKNDGSQGTDPGSKSNEPGHEGSAGSQPSKPGDDHQPGTGDTNPDHKPQEGNHSGEPDKSNTGGNQNTDNKDLQKQAQAAGDQLRKDSEGAAKTDANQHPADGKNGGEPQQQPQPADGKDGGGGQAPQGAAQPKGGPQDQPAGQHDEAAAKDGGQPDAKQPQQGEAKAGGDPMAQPDAQPGQGKDGKTEPAPTSAASKDGGKPDDVKQAAADKPQPGAAGDKSEKAGAKDAPPQNMTADARPSEAKDKAAPETKSAAKGAGPENPDKDAAKSEAKADGAKPMEAADKASAKDGGAKPDKQDVAAASKSDGGGDSQPQQADQQPVKNMDDLIKKLKDDLNSNDPQKREIAEEFIRRYVQKADDPQTRDRANQALKDAGLNPDDDRGLAEAKPPQPPQPDGQPQGQQDKPGEGKTGDDKGGQTTAKDNPPPDPMNDTAKGQSKGDGQPKDGNPMHDQAPPPGLVKEGPGNGGRTGHSVNPPAQDAHSPPPRPETPEAQRASALQLLKFYEAVPKDVLKDALLDPEKLKALEEAARNYWAKHTDGGPENPSAPQHGGTLPGGLAGKTSTPGGQPPTDDPNNGGRPLPPPGYRDPYKEFTKLLAPGGDK